MYKIIFNIVLVLANFVNGQFCRSDIESINITEYKIHAEKIHMQQNFKNLLDIHRSNYKKIHNNIQFLYFHRKYLEEYEKIMNISIPYINWERYSNNITDSIIFKKYFNRKFISSSIYGYTTNNIRNILNIGLNNFSQFSTILELGPHGLIHANIIGIMNTEMSPMDPLFWLHHSYIDRIFNSMLKKSAKVFGKVEHYNIDFGILEKNQCYKSLNIMVKSIAHRPSMTPPMGLRMKFSTESHIILEKFLEQQSNAKIYYYSSKLRLLYCIMGFLLFY